MSPFPVPPEAAPIRRVPRRRPRALLALLAAVGAGALCAPPDAGAGIYTVDWNRHGADLGAWTYAASPGSTGYAGASGNAGTGPRQWFIPPEGSVFGYRWDENASASATIAAPADTRIVGFASDRATVSTTQVADPAMGWRFESSQGGDPLAHCYRAFGCSGRDGAFVLPAGSIDAAWLRSSVICGARGGCGGYGMVAELHAGTLTLRDDHPPVLTRRPDGSLLDAGRTLRGVAAVSFAASDRGGGVARAEVLVDGVVVAQTPEGADGRCARDGDGHVAALVPCRPTLDGRLEVDTGRLADGPHSVALAIVDAAGNRATSAAAAIVTANRAPAAPRALEGATSHEEPDLALRWTNPPHAAAIAAAHVRLCRADGSACTPDRRLAGTGIDRATVTAPAPGDWIARVWLEDAVGNADVASAATAPAAWRPEPASIVAPSLSGRAVRGSTLTLDRGQWRGQAPIALSVRWERCAVEGAACAAIDGAGASAYELTPADVGHRVRAVVRAANAAGAAEASAQTAPVLPLAPREPGAAHDRGRGAVGRGARRPTGALGRRRADLRAPLGARGRGRLARASRGHRDAPRARAR